MLRRKSDTESELRLHGYNVLARATCGFAFHGSRNGVGGPPTDRLH